MPNYKYKSFVYVPMIVCTPLLVLTWFHYTSSYYVFERDFCWMFMCMFEGVFAFLAVYCSDDDTGMFEINHKSNIFFLYLFVPFFSFSFLGMRIFVGALGVVGLWILVPMEKYKIVCPQMYYSMFLWHWLCFVPATFMFIFVSTKVLKNNAKQ